MGRWAGGKGKKEGEEEEREQAKEEGRTQQIIAYFIVCVLFFE